jgi:hypothetical protein
MGKRAKVEHRRLQLLASAELLSRQFAQITGKQATPKAVLEACDCEDLETLRCCARLALAYAGVASVDLKLGVRR